MLLFPQISRVVAEQLAEERRNVSVLEAAALAAPEHPEAVYTPTGGSRATKEHLLKLRSELLSIARSYGYPEFGEERSRTPFDAPAAAALHSLMLIEPSEAAKSGVWEFLSSVLLCDLVRWRFPGEGASPLERYLSGRRNTFQRLWWRAYVFHDAEAERPYHLVESLGEDEVVQVMERPFLAGSRSLSRVVAQELQAAAERHPDVSRRDLMRNVQKRLRRLGAFTSFEMLDIKALTTLVRPLFDQVATAVRTASAEAASLQPRTGNHGSRQKAPAIAAAG